MKIFELLNRKATFQIPLWFLFTLPLFAYAAWEVYWYSKVGLRIIKWHTHLMLYVYVLVLGFVLFNIFLRKVKDESAANILLFFTSCVFSLCVVELYLGISGTYKTYPEKISGFYDSPYAPQDKDYYHVWTPNKPHYITKPEYSYWRPTNSLGLADIEWEIRKKKNEKRLLALGDSFTEGDGAPYDSSYVALFKNKLLAGGDTFYVMNAGVCGSDPFNNYILFQDKLLIYKPDVVIQTLTTSDLTTDVLLRGGMERFQKDGTLKYRAAPWWEPVYAVSYISRIFFSMAGYSELLRSPGLAHEEEEWLNESTLALLKQYAAVCKKSGIRLHIVLRPDKHEITDNKYGYDFSHILSGINADASMNLIDLLPSYRAYLKKTGTDVSDYFWKYDGHHNSKGYEMMAQTIYENIRPQLRDSSTVIVPTQ